eukprot:7290841-Heterocapsa_arctica.AAC.1
MTPDADGIRKFPADVHCVVFDNLNCCYGNENEYVGMSQEKWRRVQCLMILIPCFLSKLYVCTASAERWGLTEEYDVVSDQVRGQARKMGITYWTGDSFWNSLSLALSCTIVLPT